MTRADLPPPAREFLAWIDGLEEPPIGSDAVPGASLIERRKITGLGALAKALTQQHECNLPAEIDSWINSAPDIEPSLRSKLLDTIEAERDCDLIASLYEHVVSGVSRRHLGTFFTPPALVNYMLATAEQILGDPPRAALDPGAGVGAFTLAMARHWPKAAIHAVDVNIATLGLLASRLAPRGQVDGETHFHLDSVLTWLDSGWPALSGPRVIVGNPPYTRHQLMDSLVKDEARKASGRLISSGLAGLSSHVLAASLLRLRPDDVACLLIPGSWCETRYGRELREHLWAIRDRTVRLDFFPTELQVFPGTQVTAMIITVGPVSDRAKFEARQVDITAGRVRTLQSRTLDRSQPCPADFASFFKPPRRAVSTRALRLRDVASVRRGVATGASSYFFLSYQQAVAAQIPPTFLRPAIVKPSHFTGHQLTRMDLEHFRHRGYPQWLLTLADYGRDGAVAEIESYLQLGRDLAVHERYLPSHRKPWYVVEQVQSADLLFSPVTKTGFRIIENQSDAVASNNLYGIHMKADSPWTASDLASFLRGTVGQDLVQERSRTYQGGSAKIEPRALLDVPLLPDRTKW